MRATQFIEFLNRDEYPSNEEQQVLFTHLSTESLKDMRRKYRSGEEIREEDQLELFIASLVKER